MEDVLGDESLFTETGDALKEPDIRKMMSDLGIDVNIIKDAKHGATIEQSKVVNEKINKFLF